MIYKTPKTLPQWSDLWAGLGRPHPSSIAHTLGVDVRTVYRWMAAGEMPRPAHLALFWVSPWGLSAIDTNAYNELSTLRAMVSALRAHQARQDSHRSRELALAGFLCRAHLAANEAPPVVHEPVQRLAAQAMPAASCAPGSAPSSA